MELFRTPSPSVESIRVLVTRIRGRALAHQCALVLPSRAQLAARRHAGGRDPLQRVYWHRRVPGSTRGTDLDALRVRARFRAGTRVVFWIIFWRNKSCGGTLDRRCSYGNRDHEERALVRIRVMSELNVAVGLGLGLGLELGLRLGLELGLELGLGKVPTSSTVVFRCGSG